MLRIIYRVSNSEKSGVRPSYYSKLGCFDNLIKIINNCPERISFLTIYDGEPDNKALIKKAKTSGKFINVMHKNNSRSFRCAYEQALNYKDEDIVYFVEDDYLHLPESIAELKTAFDKIDPDYLTLYDHPVRYADEYKFGLDLPTKTEIFFAGNHHWRHQESTCMTFAARVQTLKEDKGIFWRYTATDVPEDREIFRRLQGLTGYEKGSPQRILIGPMPSLATHLHLPWLAPGIDWDEANKR
jgi:hypothetical protein